MTHYITYDTVTNTITGLFSDANGPLPPGINPISDADYNTIASRPEGFGAFKYQDGKVVCYLDDPAFILESTKQKALRDIDSFVSFLRSKYVTLDPGQSETYLSKYQDALAFKAAGYPSNDLSSYPFVQAEYHSYVDSGTTSISPQQAADIIIATRNQWMMIGSAFEYNRMLAKKLVTNATSVDAIATIMSDFGKKVKAI